MRIEVEIPKEFEGHFEQDKFEDSLRRLCTDAHLLAGKYDIEVAIMLIKAFKESKPAYDVEKVVADIKKSSTDDDGLIVKDGKEPMIWKSKAIEIVRNGGKSLQHQQEPN